MRVELRDGQWAELRKRITHGQDKEIRRARVLTRDNPEEHAADDFTVLLRAFISGWYVLDLDGKPIDLGDADAIERCPSDITNELIGETLPLYFPATVPNASTPPSSDDSSSDKS
jgi:hypothetical protein